MCHARPSKVNFSFVRVKIDTTFAFICSFAGEAPVDVWSKSEVNSVFWV